jgi:hypothetical protein
LRNIGVGVFVIIEVIPVHDFVFTFAGHWRRWHISGARRRPSVHGASRAGSALLELLIDLLGSVYVLYLL